jgi:glutamate synthase domain-containing protein 2
MSDRFSQFVDQGLNILGAVLVIVLVVSAVVLVGVYIHDRRQRHHAVLRNFPILGHLRYFFEDVGEFFRQYFFAADREEMPFNRAQRSWVYRAAKDLDNTIAFGSTRLLTPVGTVMFVNYPFPILRMDAVDTSTVTVGPYCEKPYTTNSIFNVSGMSYGAISKPAIRALSHGAAKAGCWINTGEGGLSDFHLEGGCDIIFQIGTAKYGVRHEDGSLSREKLRGVAGHEQVKMFEIKLSQGAKPGKGGMLPGSKVTPEVAKARGIPVGQDSISPNRHPDVRTNDELLDLIDQVRTITGKPTGFKAVIGSYDWVEDLCDAIVDRGIECAPDFITIDSADGGTGAAPAPLMDYVGLPITETLPIVVNILRRHGLKDRIKVIASGKMITPDGVATALCMGADFVNSARGFMFSLGCIQALQCNKNTCPTGITTHDEKLQRGLDPEIKAERVAHYVENMRHEVKMIAHSCGVREPRQLNRHHARIVGEDGRTISLDQLYPEGTMAPEGRTITYL